MSPVQSAAPVLDAISRYRERGDLSFTSPGHRGGVGVDQATLGVLGGDMFANDIDMLNGLDDRTESTSVLSQAEELMADALGVKQGYFSTGGFTLSVKTAFLALADVGDQVIVARNSNKSVVEAIILSGVEPVRAARVGRAVGDLPSARPGHDHPPAAGSSRSQGGVPGVADRLRRGRPGRGDRSGLPRGRQAVGRRRGVGRALSLASGACRCPRCTPART